MPSLWRDGAETCRRSARNPRLHALPTRSDYAEDVKPLAILALLLGSAHADSWAPYGQRLHVAENEKYFLVLRHQDGEKRETAFELYERAADTKPPRVQETRLDETKVIVDAGDRVICKGVLN